MPANLAGEVVKLLTGKPIGQLIAENGKSLAKIPDFELPIVSHLSTRRCVRADRFCRDAVRRKG